MDELLPYIHILTSWQVLVTFVAFVVALLWFKRAYRDNSVIIISLIATELVVSYLKGVFAVPRPDGAFIALSDYAFPSGHAALSTCLATVMILVVGKHIPRKIMPLYVLFWISIAGLVSYSRIMLGVHRPEEVVAGIIVGLAVPLVLVLFVLCIKRQRRYWV